jgi:hypothetical protein
MQMPARPDGPVRVVIDTDAAIAGLPTKFDTHGG